MITDRSKAVFLLWFYIACFGVGFSDVSPYVCTDVYSCFLPLLISFSSVRTVKIAVIKTVLKSFRFFVDLTPV